MFIYNTASPIMYTSLNRYNFLSRRLGNSSSTEMVVTKCFLDQMVFSTQSNLIFLGICAANDTKKLPLAVNEVRRTFLTTWIADCGIWPVVNFFGFAFVPMKFQPFYMVSVQFLWQIYASALAGNGKDVIEDEETIEDIFRALDDDASGYIDVSELEKELKRRGMKFNDGDLEKIMRTVDENGDGQISLEEFKNAIKSGAMKNTVLWGLLSEDLAKGAKAALKKLERMKDSDPKVSEAQEAKDKKNREDAIKSALIGGSILFAMSLTRKFAMKI